MSFKLYTPLFALLAFASAAPVDNRGSNQCVKQCSEPVNLVYQTGNTYVYKFLTKTNIEFGSDVQEISISGLADITNVGSCEFGLKLRDVQVFGVPEAESYAARLQNQILPFNFDDGAVVAICPGAEESWALNIKRAILSALQISTKSLGSTTKVVETDVMGICETTYDVAAESAEGTTVKKTKSLNGCSKHTSVYSMFLPGDLLALLMQNNVYHKSSYQCTQVIGKNKDKVLKKVHCVDDARLQHNVASKKHYYRSSTMELSLQKTLPSTLGALPDRYTKDTLLFEQESKFITSNAKAEELLLNLCNEISNEVTMDAPLKYKRLVYGLKGLDYEGVKSLMKKVSEDGGIGACKATKLSGILTSALVMSGGSGALKFLTQDFSKASKEDPSRIMTVLSLPFLSNPTGETVESLIPFVQNVKCPKLTLFASALIGNYLRKKEKTEARTKLVEPAVEAISNRIPSNCEDNAAVIITYLKALGNIGHLTPSALSKVIGCTKVPTDSVRTAAVDVFRRGKTCNCPDTVGIEARNVLENLMKQSGERDEVAVAAFRAMMSCSEGYGVEALVQNAKNVLSGSNARLAAYAYTYLLSLQKANTPEKLAISQRLSNERLSVSNELPKDVLPSKHQAFSYYSESLKVGFDIETDVILNEGSNFPRLLTASVGIPALNRTVSILEVGVRQEGIERDIKSLLGNNGLLSAKFANELAERIKEIIEGRHYMEALAEIRQRLMILFTNARHLSVYINYNGNTLLYLSSDELERLRPKRGAFVDRFMRSLGEGRGRPDLLTEKGVVEKISETVKLMDGFGYGFYLKTWMKKPTVSGMAMIVGSTLSGVTSTKPIQKVSASTTKKPLFGELDAGYNDETIEEKAYKLSLLPSFAVDYTTGVVASLGPANIIALKHTMTAASNLAVILRLVSNSGKAKAIELQLPQKEVNIFKYKRSVYTSNGVKHQAVSEKESTFSHCANSGARDMLGYDICVSGVKPKSGGRLGDSESEVNVVLKQTDMDMSGWSIVAAYPDPSKNGDDFYYHVLLRTPGSKIDRTIEAKIKRFHSEPNTCRYDYTIRDPKNKYTGSITSKKEPKTGDYSLQLSSAGHTFEVSRATQGPSTKISFKAIKDSKPSIYKNYDLLLTQSPSTNNIKVELLSNSRDGSSLRLFNAEAKSEGRLSPLRLKRSAEENFRSSLVLNFGNPKLNQFTNIVLNLNKNVPSRQLAFDATIDYKCPKMSKSEKIELTTKINNKGSDNDVHLQTTGELTSSEYPIVNGLLSQKLIFKPSKQLENELLIKWKKSATDKKQKIHLLQFTKLIEASGKDSKALENKFKVYVGPINLNKELYYTGSLYKHDAELRDGNNPENVHKAKAYYDLLAESPLKITYGASYKSPMAEYSFTEEVNEVRPNQIEAKGIFKRQVSGQPTTGYLINTLQVSSSNQSYHNTDIKISKIEDNENIGAIKLLYDRANGESTQLDSSVVHRGTPLMTLNHYFSSKNYKWQTLVSVRGYATVNLDINKSPSEKMLKHKLSVKSDNYKINHDTIGNFKLDNNLVGSNIESMTSMDGKVLYKLTAAHVANKNFRATFTKDDLNMKLTKDSFDPKGMSIAFDYQNKDLTHKTSVIKNPSEKLLSIASETKRGTDLKNKAAFKVVDQRTVLALYNTPGVLDFFYESKTPHNRYLKIDHTRTGLLQETTWTSEPKPYNFNLKSKLKQKGKKDLYDLKVTGFFVSHTIYEVKSNVNLAENVNLTMSVESSSKKKVVNMDIKKTNENQGINVRATRSAQRNSIRVTRKVNDQDAWTVDSQTDDNGVTMGISNSEVAMSIKLGKLGKVPREHKITVQGKKKDYQHETAIQITKDAASLQSKTSLNKEVISQLSSNCTKKGCTTAYESKRVVISAEAAWPDSKTAKYDINLLTKYNQKQRSLLIKRKITEGDAPVLKMDLEYNGDTSRDKKYIATATVPLKVDKIMTVTYDSKHPNGCEGKFSAQINTEKGGNRDYDYVRTCGSEVAKLTVTRRGNSRQVTYTNNGQQVLKIEASASKEGTTALAKIKVDSTIKPIDGSYLDLKVDSADGNRKLDLATKLPLLQTTIKVNYMRTHTPEISVKLIASLENPNTGNRYDLEHLVNVKNPLSVSTSLKRNKTETLLLYNVFSDGHNRYLGLDIPPTGNKFNVSHLHPNGAHIISALVVLKNTPLVKMETTIKGDALNRESTSEGSILGIPMSSKMVITKETSDLKVSVKPMVANYPYPIPEKLRLSDCYEPSEQECISLHSVTDNIKRKLKSMDIKMKIKKHHKHVITAKYENNDAEGKLQRKLLLTMDGAPLGWVRTKTENQKSVEIQLKDRTVKLEKVTNPNGKTITLWTDLVKKPNEKLVYTKTTTGDGPKKTTVRTLSHPSLTKTVTLTTEAENQGEKIIAKSVLDYSSNPDDKIIIEKELTIPQSSNQLMNKELVRKVKVYRADKKVELAFEESVTATKNQQSEDKRDGSVSHVRKLSWKGPDGKLKEVSSNTDLKVIIDKLSDTPVKILYNKVVDKLALYYTANAEILVQKGLPIPILHHLDIGFAKDGEKYRLSSNVVRSEAKSCLLVNLFKLPETGKNKKITEICRIKDQSQQNKLVTMRMGDETGQNNAVDLDISRKATDNNIVVVTLKWDPEQVESNVVAGFNQLSELYLKDDQNKAELRKELRSQLKALAPTFRDQVTKPLAAYYKAEADKIVSENPEWAHALRSSGGSRTKRSVEAWREKIRQNANLSLLSKVFGFKLITFNPEAGELIFEIGSPSALNRLGA